MGSKEENEKQKKIFGKNLTALVESKYPKQQKDIAKELGEYPTTFNTWCMGKSMPGMGKIQKIADYFGVGKSALLDEKPTPPEFNSDQIELLEMYSKLTTEQKHQVLALLRSFVN